MMVTLFSLPTPASVSGEGPVSYQPYPCVSPSLEPEETKDTTDAHLLLKDLGYGHARINELLPSLVTDAGHERGRFSDQTQLLSRYKDKGLWWPAEGFCPHDR